jgi:hypothetical protein
MDVSIAKKLIENWLPQKYHPYAPCMVYLPTKLGDF